MRMKHTTRLKKRSAARSGAKRKPRGRATSPPRSRRRWSAGVMEKSDALDLENGVFTQRSARQIAVSLKHSAESSHRRKAEPFQSAMSMLNFHINRGGRGLTGERRRVLNQAKVELRKLFRR